MTAYALPDEHDRDDDDDQEKRGGDGAGDDSTFQASSRASVPEKIACGARYELGDGRAIELQNSALRHRASIIRLFLCAGHSTFCTRFAKNRPMPTSSVRS